MVAKFTSLLTPAVLMAATIASVRSAPVPAALQKKEVGSLTCVPVKVGTLSLYNTNTKQTEFATFNNNFTLKDYLNGQAVPKDDSDYTNTALLSSDSSVSQDQAEFEFSVCYPKADESKAFPPNNGGVYYGHLSPVQDTNKQCATHLGLYADTNFLGLEDCYYSFDSGAQFSYFAYYPDQDGLVQYIDNSFPYSFSTANNQQRGDQYTFTPGQDAQHPAVSVHDGDPKFSDWVLRLN